MKKILAFVLSLSLVFALTGCDAKNKTFEINDASKIKIHSMSFDEIVEITDVQEIKYITDNINALTFVKNKKASKTENGGWLYSLAWYDIDGNCMEQINLQGDSYTISYDGYTYKSKEADVEIDISFLDELYNEKGQEELDPKLINRENHQNQQDLQFKQDQTQQVQNKIESILPYYIIYNNSYYQSIKDGPITEYDFEQVEYIGDISVLYPENKLAYENFASNLCPVGAKVYKVNDDEIVSEFWYQGKEKEENHYYTLMSKIVDRVPE